MPGSHALAGAILGVFAAVCGCGSRGTPEGPGEAPDWGEVLIQVADTCPGLTYVVGPLRTTVGTEIMLHAQANIPAPGVEFHWSVTSGTVDSPDAPETTYRCRAAGKVTLGITLSKESCPDDAASVELECVEPVCVCESSAGAGGEDGAAGSGWRPPCTCGGAAAAGGAGGSSSS
jgi:hypothetical protein